MLSRLKKLLTRKPKRDIINVPLDVTTLSIEQLESLLALMKDEQTTDVSTEKGEFLSDMTDEETLQYERNERLGWKGLKLPWQ